MTSLLICVSRYSFVTVCVYNLGQMILNSIMDFRPKSRETNFHTVNHSLFIEIVKLEFEFVSRLLVGRTSCFSILLETNLKNTLRSS